MEQKTTNSKNLEKATNSNVKKSNSRSGNKKVSNTKKEDKKPNKKTSKTDINDEIKKNKKKVNKSNLNTVEQDSDKNKMGSSVPDKEIERIKKKLNDEKENLNIETKVDDKIQETKSEIKTGAGSCKAIISKIKNLGFYKITTILLAILSFILFLCLISNNSKKAITYNVTNLVPSYKDKENVFLSLPINHRLSNEGIIYYVDDENIKALCTMSCVEASEEDFDGAIEYYKQNLNLEEQESINDFKVGKIIQEQNGIPFTYYFLYKDGLFNEFIFTGCDDETMLSILKGFNY